MLVKVSITIKHNKVPFTRLKVDRDQDLPLVRIRIADPIQF